MYKLIFSRDFYKDFKKLDKNIQVQIKTKLIKLKENPEFGKHLLYLDLWSLRVNKYRILYKIKEKNLTILILKLKHRKSVYKDI